MLKDFKFIFGFGANTRHKVQPIANKGNGNDFNNDLLFHKYMEK